MNLRKIYANLYMYIYICIHVLVDISSIHVRVKMEGHYFFFFSPDARSMTPKHESLIRTPKHDPLSMTPQGSELSVDRPEAILRPAPGRPLPPHSATPAPLPIGSPPRYVSTWKSTLAKWNRLKAVPWTQYLGNT